MNVEKLYSRAEKQYEYKNYDEALKLIDKIKRYEPSFRKAYFLEGGIWLKLNNPVKERDALKETPSMFDLKNPNEWSLATTILSTLATATANLGLNEEAMKIFRMVAEYSVKENINLNALDSAIYIGSYTENCSATDLKALYDKYKKYLVDIKPYPKKFYSHEKIRVGFMSADFYRHPALHWSWALFTNLDKNSFEKCYYSNVETPDELTEYLRSNADIWQDIKDLTDEAAAKLIRDDEIDILFDLSGHTKGNRLPVAAYRPASVQISGIGYINSTGLDCFDYFLSDIYCAGNEAAMNEYFTEKIIKLPHSHICYELRANIEPADYPPCVRNGYVTFGSFNQFRKITDSILSTWKKILDAVPDSRLILKHKIFDTEDGKKFVIERLKNFNFDLARVDMRGFSPSWLVEYGDVDIALDTFPYTGGVTTCEALYMGVPVISLYGDRHGTRFGLSILSNVGLAELAVDSYDEYINRAVALASDWELLAILRKNLRGMMEKSPLMDSANYTREVQDAFIKILR